jgi:hypothetical protein
VLRDGLGYRLRETVPHRMGYILDILLQGPWPLPLVLEVCPDILDVLVRSLTIQGPCLPTRVPLSRC